MFPCCSTCEDLSIDVSIIYCRTDIDEAMVISFLGVRTDGQTDGQIDTVLESSYGNMTAHKKFQLKTQN